MSIVKDFPLFPLGLVALPSELIPLPRISWRWFLSSTSFSYV